MANKFFSYGLIVGLLVVRISGCQVHEDPPNWGFETGDFSSWIVTGNAFQVTSLATFAPRRYYNSLGSYHVIGSVIGQGHLESIPFTLSDTGYVSFLLSGQQSDLSGVYIVNDLTDEIIKVIRNEFYDDPTYTNAFLRFNIDLSEYIGIPLRLLLIDDSSSDMLNFDQFEYDIDMTTWTTYRVDTNIRLGLENYEDMTLAANHYIRENAWKIQDEQRFRYHVTGEIGWINDPNGFSYYNNQIHLFYQHNPYQTVWGPMHWGHVTSTDFVKWNYEEIALAPDQDYDSVGAFSGSAIEKDGTYYLVYTGAAPGRQVQAIATSTDGIHFTKSTSNPIIAESKLPANTNIADFRDPKVWEKDGWVYMIVSARNADNQYSKLLLYKTQNMTDWTYAGKLLSNNSNYSAKLGIMFECPDYLEIGGRSVIIVSPQTVVGSQTGDSNVYIVGDLNYQTGVFENWSYDAVEKLDYGTDFYAPQTMKMPDGRTVMVAWMASWNRAPIYKSIGLAGALTLPRELSLVNGKMVQQPIRELASYHRNTLETAVTSSHERTQLNVGSSFARDITLSFTPSEGQSGITVFDDGTGKGLNVYYNDGKVYADRRGITDGHYASTDFHNLVSVDAPLQNGEITLRLILDRYSAEIFVNDGAKVMTLTGFPNATQTGISMFSDSTTTFDLVTHDIVV